MNFGSFQELYQFLQQGAPEAKRYEEPPEEPVVEEAPVKEEPVEEEQVEEPVVEEEPSKKRRRNG